MADERMDLQRELAEMKDGVARKRIELQDSIAGEKIDLQKSAQMAKTAENITKDFFRR